MKKFIKKWVRLIKENWKDKRWWGYLLIRAYYRLFGVIHEIISTRVIDKNWDILIILDACRYDLLKKHLPKKYQKNFKYIYSIGSCTPEFLKKTFSGKKLSNTIYITANPFVNLLVPNSFNKIIPAWKFAWNKEYGTVLPADMVKISKIIFQKNSDKKFIIHFMQPHYPFIAHPEIKGTFTGLKSAASNKDIKLLGKDINPWHLMRDGEYTINKVWNAYEDNIKLVIPYVIKLINFFRKNKKKVIITADHGNIVKKIGNTIFVSGHPCGLYFKGLVKVPWVTFNFR